jgi:hypothetical protein
MLIASLQQACVTHIRIRAFGCKARPNEITELAQVIYESSFILPGVKNQFDVAKTLTPGAESHVTVMFIANMKLIRRYMQFVEYLDSYGGMKWRLLYGPEGAELVGLSRDAANPDGVTYKVYSCIIHVLKALGGFPFDVPRLTSSAKTKLETLLTFSDRLADYLAKNHGFGEGMRIEGTFIGRNLHAVLQRIHDEGLLDECRVPRLSGDELLVNHISNDVYVRHIKRCLGLAVEDGLGERKGHFLHERDQNHFRILFNVIGQSESITQPYWSKTWVKDCLTDWRRLQGRHDDPSTTTSTPSPEELSEPELPPTPIRVRLELQRPGTRRLISRADSVLMCAGTSRVGQMRTALEQTIWDTIKTGVHPRNRQICLLTKGGRIGKSFGSKDLLVSYVAAMYGDRWITVFPHEGETPAIKNEDVAIEHDPNVSKAVTRRHDASGTVRVRLIRFQCFFLCFFMDCVLHRKSSTSCRTRLVFWKYQDG